MKAKSGKRRKPNVAVDDEIRKIAESLIGAWEQSCLALKPIVDDACRNPAMIGEQELEHIFDYVLDVACCPKGHRMFNRLCKTFGTIYPECVKFYIDSDREMNGPNP